MKQKRTVEDYLKTIYILQKHGEVHGSSIAEMLGVSRPTVSVSLKALEEEGYLKFNEAREVALTEAGLEIARDIYERHQTLRQLLQSLGVDEETAAKDACQMEHTVSRDSYLALKSLLKKEV